ncbi:unnamed protein product [Effrenium voratum]|nr:unnamed protein product [Effrenium voratum]
MLGNSAPAAKCCQTSSIQKAILAEGKRVKMLLPFFQLFNHGCQAPACMRCRVGERGPVLVGGWYFHEDFGSQWQDQLRHQRAHKLRRRHGADCHGQHAGARCSRQPAGLTQATRSTPSTAATQDFASSSPESTVIEGVKNTTGMQPFDYDMTKSSFTSYLGGGDSEADAKLVVEAIIFKRIPFCRLIPFLPTTNKVIADGSSEGGW